MFGKLGKQEQDLGREVAELIGAIGVYLGGMETKEKGDKDRLRRAMKKALKSKAFIRYMRKF